MKIDLYLHLDNETGEIWVDTAEEHRHRIECGFELEEMSIYLAESDEFNEYLNSYYPGEIFILSAEDKVKVLEEFKKEYFKNYDYNKEWFKETKEIHIEG